MSTLLAERAPPSGDSSATVARLLPVKFTPSKLLYSLSHLPGAMQLPLLAEPALMALAKASANLERSGYKLMVWDAFRTRATQRHIFESYRETLRIVHPGLDDRELHRLAKVFVSDPDGVFPHGTGGAVDVTLLRDGCELDLGTGFDDFSERGGAEYFVHHPPMTPADRAAAAHRAALREAMLGAGFTGIDSEWWHFEIYTPNWAEATGLAPQLVEVLGDAVQADPATTVEVRRRFWPMLQSGAAAPFLSPVDRRMSLAGERKGHYYARTSTRTTDDIEAVLAETFGAESARVVQSGLAAWSCALRALLPAGGTVILDKHVYYESRVALMHYARLARVTVIKADLGSAACLAEAIDTAGGRVDLIIADSPSNWYLDTLDLVHLRSTADKVGARLLIDTSVQPLQEGVAALADVVVVSLSKWPSSGYTIGGAILGRSEMVAAVARVAAIDGHAMPAEAAFTVLQQLLSLEDRIRAVSAKALYIKALVSAHPAVAQVRLPAGPTLLGLCGGQLTIELKDAQDGGRLEQLIGFNSLCRALTLPQLACTFGGANSTIEHFATNVRQRDGMAMDRHASGEAQIPPTFVRLSVGGESGEALAEGLLLMLNLLQSEHPYAP